MDYDVSISIGTTANLGDLAKANKAVQDLSKAAKQVPDSLLSGGVGGTAAPAYTGAASGGGMTWRLEGAAELSHAVKTMDGALRQAGKNFTVTSQRLDRSASLLSRSISTLTSLPGKLQAWGSSTMQSWNQFNGGLQNLKNVIGLGKQAWDLGWSIGESLNEAFGVKAKQIDAKLAGIIQAAQDKLARWQDSINSARAQHREDAFLKQEAAGVKQVNDAYAARLRTIEAIDRKAMAGLEHQQKLLQIENEKNRHIIQERKIRGEITESQARDMLAMIDAKDANERMEIERKQADQAAQTAQARADAAEERYRKLQELSRSGMARQAVQDLKPMQVLNQADALKQADEEPALVVVHTPFLGLGAGHARQVGLPADVIDQYRAAPAGLLLVACAHHGRALAGMVQEHDRAPGIGGDGLHATDDLGHGAAGVFFLDVEPAQRVQHHQAAALGGALEAVEPLRGHDVGQAADQRLDQQAVSHGLPFLGAEVRPKGVQAVMNGGGRVFGGQVDHRAGGQFAHLQQIRPACNLCGQLQGQHGFTGTTGRHQRPDRTGHHVGQNVVQRWRRCCERLQNIDRLMGSH